MSQSIRNANRAYGSGPQGLDRGLLWVMGLLSIALSAQVVGQSGCDAVFLPGIDTNYEEDIQPIFDDNCVSCHQPGGEGFQATGLDLRPGFSYLNLVNAKSSQDPGWTLVEPGRNADSLLVQKIQCDEPVVGERMPKGGPNLRSDAIMFVGNWITDGSLPGSVETTHPINFGMTGSWYNPEAAGQGFVVDVIVERDPQALVLYWFTYTDEEEAGSEQRWYVAEGAFEEGDPRVRLNVHHAAGGRFDSASPEPDVTEVGVAEIFFESCTDAILTYILESSPSGSQLHGEIPLKRLSPDVVCAEPVEE